tara:strand:+ start:79 stop:345 length:267 start_codon:yes stop_codon:yes gene_type:complete
MVKVFTYKRESGKDRYEVSIDVNHDRTISHESHSIEFSIGELKEHFNNYIRELDDIKKHVHSIESKERSDKRRLPEKELERLLKFIND